MKILNIENIENISKYTIGKQNFGQIKEIL